MFLFFIIMIVLYSELFFVIIVVIIVVVVIIIVIIIVVPIGYLPMIVEATLNVKITNNLPVPADTLFLYLIVFP